MVVSEVLGSGFRLFFGYAMQLIDVINYYSANLSKAMAPLLLKQEILRPCGPQDDAPSPCHPEQSEGPPLLKQRITLHKNKNVTATLTSSKVDSF